MFQGDRTKNVGVVDSEYIVHKGIQTLGGNDDKLTKVFCFISLQMFELISYPAFFLMHYAFANKMIWLHYLDGYCISNCSK